MVCKYSTIMPAIQSSLSIVTNYFSNAQFKNLVKQKVTDYWQQRLRCEAKSKPSLCYFKPEFMSLQKPHQIFTSCNSNPFEINKAIIQCRLLSGRYPTDWLSRHWTRDNKDGFCVLCPPGESVPGSIEHFLIECCTLEPKRLEIFNFWRDQTYDNSDLYTLLTLKRNASVTEFTQLLLDPSVDPDVISGAQQNLFSISMLFKLTRTYVYGLHRRKLKLTGKFNKST